MLEENDTEDGVSDGDTEESPQPPRFYNLERDRGVLTKSDREFLIGEKELEGQAERNARYRIRNRVEDALLDFFLLNAISEEDRKRIFENIISGPDGTKPLTETINFLYQGCFDVADSQEGGEDLFKESLYTAIRQVERSRFEVVADPKLSIERDRPDHDKLHNKLIAGNATIQEFTFYMENGDGTVYNELAKLQKPLVVIDGGEEITIFTSEELQSMVNQQPEE